jgi:hypothetical protein
LTLSFVGISVSLILCLPLFKSLPHFGGAHSPGTFW